jgi:hypothetical protein
MHTELRRAGGLDRLSANPPHVVYKTTTVEKFTDIYASDSAPVVVKLSEILGQAGLTEGQ